jgi:hypothetical protein
MNKHQHFFRLNELPLKDDTKVSIVPKIEYFQLLVILRMK